MADNSTEIHYVDEQGKKYFAYQNQGGLDRGRINARKFSKHVRESDTVLDFGCGSGALLFCLPCQKRIGVEINPVARTEAEKLGIEAHETLKTIPDRSINVIISNHALEHVPAPLYTLKSLSSKLLSDGRIVLCVPIDDWRTQKHYYPNEKNHHLYTWTPLLLGNLLVDAGYKVDNIWIYNHAWPPVYWQFLNAHLPIWLFDIICNFVSWRDRRRQIIAVAKL